MYGSFKGVPNDEVYSPMMLKCFITISDSKVRTILTDIEAGSSKISSKEINKLTDINSLKNIPESVLKKKANELEKALKEFNKLHEQFEGARDGDMDDDQMDYDDDDYDDDYFQNEHPVRIHFLGLIPKGLKGIFKVFKNYISLFFFFILVYVSLWTLRKINEPDKKIKNKKKIEEKEENEEYEENEEKEEKEENDRQKENDSKNNEKLKEDKIEENQKEIIKEKKDINNNKEKIE